MTSIRQKVTRLSWFAYGTFVGLLSLCLYFDMLDAYRRDEFSIRHINGAIRVTDFVKFYMGASMARPGGATNVYEWKNQQEFFRNIFHCDPPESDLYTQTFPLTFVLIAPISFLPLNTAQLVFDLLTLVFGSVAFARLFTSLSPQSKEKNLLIYLGVLYSFPAYQCLLTGQLSWLLLGIVSLYALCLSERKQIWAGLLLALTIIKPQYTIFLALPPLFAKQFRVIASALVFDLLFLGLSTFLLGWQSLTDYPASLKHVEAGFKVSPDMMPCIRGLLTPFMSQELALNVSTIVMMLAFVGQAIFFFLKRSELECETGISTALCVAITAALFFSAHSQPYDSLLLALPAVYFLRYRGLVDSGDRSGGSVNRLHKFAEGLFISYPFISWICFYISQFTAIRALALLGLPTLVFYLASAQKLAKLHTEKK